jgi:isopenicillin-N N-acyltransferase like protein
MPSSRLAFLEIAGTPRQRGRAYGEGLRKLIGERDRRWRHEIETQGKIAADAFIESFLQQTNFLPAIDRWTPDLHEEVRGIAEGSGLAYRAVLAAQFMDEEWWFQRQSHAHCSSFGVARTGEPTLVGQTMDLPSWMDGFQTLLLIRNAKPGLDSYVVTAAGMISLTGMNSRGFAISVNTLLQLKHAVDGLPVAFITRHLIETAAVDQAVQFLQEVRHASGQNYVIGDGTQVRDFECGGDVVAEHKGDDGRVWHTNHPLVNGNLRPDRTEPWWAHKLQDSSTRLAALERRLADGSPFSVEHAKAMLASRDHGEFPVSQEVREGSDGCTFAAMVAELGRKPRLSVAPGAPSQHPFAVFEFAGQAAASRAAE